MVNTHHQPEQLKYHQHRVAVSKSFTFDAAHFLHQYEGKCKYLHGHTYRLEIMLSGIPNEIGIVADFSEIKEIYEQEIKQKLDHRFLNEVLPQMNTTAENMLVWIWEVLDKALTARGLNENGLRIEELVLYETPTSYAKLLRSWMEDEK